MRGGAGLLAVVVVLQGFISVHVRDLGECNWVCVLVVTGHQGQGGVQ